MTKTLSIEKLVTGYKKRIVLPDFSAAGIRSGEIVALAGPNGAGKSTLLRAIAGLIPAEGRVLLDGQNLLAQSLRERSKSIVFMPQSLPQATNLLAIETVLSALNVSSTNAASGNSSRQDKALAALARVGASEQALEPIDRLSGGQRQLIAIAQAIVRDPALMLLDEPTSALDLRNQLEVMSIVRDLASEGRIVIVVMHDLSLAARWADRILLLHRGKLVTDGKPEDAITPATLAAAYGVHARVERCSKGFLHVVADTPTS